MHEAFAAQVASNIQALESDAWAREKLGRSKAVGKVDRERLNVCGGSIALGHPFGATGARITTTLANELRRRNGSSACSRSAPRAAWASRWCWSDERTGAPRGHHGPRPDPLHPRAVLHDAARATSART